MGVQGLWEILEPAGQSVSLTKIAVVDGFENNESGRRAYRVGIDASIWYQHADHSTTAGANPELRLLFFRLAKLARLPWLVLFVFDGHERPKVKRGSRMGKSGSHNLTQKFKTMIKCYGMEWQMARGEAEAELAYLNAQGIIDAIITDDVDTLVFGARTIIRNPSFSLTGNRKNPATDASGKKCDQHVMVFTSDRISGHPNISLTRSGMILFAMLSGGDYDKGVKGLGPKVAHGLARCGFGDRLVAAYRQGEAHFRAFLPQWRTDVNTELHTNSRGLLPHRCPSSTLQSNWPDIALLDAYVNPICSGTSGQGIAGLALRDRTDMSLPRLAKFCEDHFDEWAHRSRILERFYNFMWEGAVFNVLRRAALEADDKEKTKRVREGRPVAIKEPLRPAPADGVGTSASLVQRCLNPPKKDLREERLASAFVNRRAPSTSASAANNIPDTHPLIDSIVGSRQHAQTDKLLEYRIVIRCKQLEDLANKGIVGKHPEPLSSAASVSHNLPDEDGIYGTNSSKKSAKPVDKTLKRIWVAASIMRQVHPGLTEQFETEGPPRVNRRRKNAAAVDEDDESEDDDGFRITDRSSSPVRSQPVARAREAVAHTSAAAVRQSTPRPTLTSSHLPVLPPPPPPRPRIMHNVGDINFEKSGNKNTFLFTFTDPCDPAMLILDDEPYPSESNEFHEGSSTMASTSSISGRSAQDNMPTYRRQAIAPGFVDLDEGDDNDDNEPLPSQFTATQEAIFDRVLGIAGGPSRGANRKTATTSKRNNSAAASHPAFSRKTSLSNASTSSQPAAAQNATTDRVMGVDAPSASSKGKGKEARGTSRGRANRAAPVPMPDAAAYATMDTHQHPSQYTAAQEAMMDNALGMGGGSRFGSSKRTTGTARKRGGSHAMSAPDDSFDEPLPSQFSTAQEAMMDAALGIGGGAPQRKVRTSVPRKRSAVQEATTGTQQAKRHKANSSAAPVSVPVVRAPTSSTQPSSSKQRQPTGRAYPDLPPHLGEPMYQPTSYSQHAAAPPRLSCIDDAVDISDDEPFTCASSSKRAPMARRTNAWDMMPSSSQESRLDDAQFDFDFS